MKKITTIFYALFLGLFLFGCSKEVKIDKITLDKEEVILNVGNSYQFLTTLNPEVSNAKLEWFTLNHKVARVDEEGKVTAISEGVTTIVVKTENGKIATSKVSVLPTEVNSISLDKLSGVIQINKNLELNATLAPSNGKFDKIEWLSENEEIATVTSYGKQAIVLAKQIGEVKISASVTVGTNKYTSTSTLTIVGLPLEKFKIDKEGYTLNQENQLELSLNNEYKFAYQVEPNEVGNIEVVWSSSDEDVFVVDQEGNVTTVGEGEAELKVETNYLNGSHSDTITVKVIDKPVTHLEITSTYREFYEGEEYELGVIFNNNQTKPSNTDVVWSVEEDYQNIVSIDENGILKVEILTQLEEREVTIYAASGSVETSKIIMVVPKSVKTNVVDQFVYVGEEVELITVLNPSNLDVEVVYTSEDDNLAEYLLENRFIAKAEGYVNLIATIEIADGVFRSTELEIRVLPVAELIEITIVNEESELYEGETLKIRYDFDPITPTYQDVEWSSSDEEVATVDSKGNVLAIAPGEVTITITSSKYLDISDSITLTILKVNNIVEISLNKNNLELFKGETFKLNETVVTEDEEQEATYPELTWTSSNTTAVTVDSSSLLTAVGVGKATITVKSQNGISATCVVNVKAVINVESISLSIENNQALAVEDELEFYVIITPLNATYKDFEVIVDESKLVVTLDLETGKVNLAALEEGETVVTIRMNDKNSHILDLTLNITIS